MNGLRKKAENGLMTNLNSISSSLSSLDTVGRRANPSTSKNYSIANSTSLLWPKSNGTTKNNSNNNNNTYATTRMNSDIYYSGGRTFTSYCFNSETALNFILIPTLLLTITRQVFDFLGQIWLQILINFFTIILLIVALFGIRQHRISYLSIYLIWSLFNTVWNIVVIRIYSKVRDIGVNEDFLSLYTGATSWWHNNGPGCLPYNITSIQPTISHIIQPSILAGCRFDYHTLEISQALVHALLSFISCLFCGCLVSKICQNPKNQYKPDKLYRLNTLTNSRRSRVNQDPSVSSRHNSTSLRRAVNKDNSTRSSQHSLSSQRSAARRRGRQPTGSTSSSIQRSQKYGSLSSRRSSKKERRDASSLTYGTTVSGSERAGPSKRTRLSSMSSNDYLPSYQPPHSSKSNLLSSYGEVSSIDSYNNKQSTRRRPVSGNANPTYSGSRSSIYSQSKTNNVNGNYDYIYGNARSDNYGASSSNNVDNNRPTRHSIRNGSENGHYERHQPSAQETRVESHQFDNNLAGESSTNAKLIMATNATFQSFSRSNNQYNGNGFSQVNGDQKEINNNYLSIDNKRKSQPTFENRNSRLPIYSNHNTGETPM